MKRSARADAFTKGFEKLRLRAYLPTPNDKPTIGWGQTGPDIRLGMVWTKEQADAAYERHAAATDAALSRNLYGIPTTQGQFDALFSFVFNVGLKNLLGSTLFRLHKAGQHRAAAEQFGKWVYQKKAKLAGLVRRRAGERALYEGTA